MHCIALKAGGMALRYLQYSIKSLLIELAHNVLTNPVQGWPQGVSYIKEKKIVRNFPYKTGVCCDVVKALQGAVKQSHGEAQVPLRSASAHPSPGESSTCSCL